MIYTLKIMIQDKNEYIITFIIFCLITIKLHLYNNMQIRPTDQ